MKKLVLTILLLGQTLGCFAQDPDLFRTWNLYELQLTDIDPIYVVSEIDPPIMPTLTIYSNYTFEGVAACNTFSGSWFYDANVYTLTGFQSTMMECENEIQNDFEDAYFDFFDFFYFVEIVQENDGLLLEFGSFDDGYAIFRDYILPIEDNPISSRIKLFPNPTSDRLSISSEGIFIESIQVFNINGKLLLTETSNWQDVNVSGLTTGIYLLRIESESGTTVKKFVKN